MTQPGARRGRKPLNPDILYADIKQLLTAAFGAGEARIILASPQAATVQLQRMNRYRRILRENSVDGISVYDNWMFRIARHDARVIEVVFRDRLTPDNVHIQTMGGQSLDAEFRRAYRPIDSYGRPVDDARGALPGPMADAANPLGVEVDIKPGLVDHWEDPIDNDTQNNVGDKHKPPADWEKIKK